MILPPKKRRFSFNDVSRLLEARKADLLCEKIIIYFLVRKRLSNDDVGVATGNVVQEIRPGAGFKTGDFVKEKLGEISYRRTTPARYSQPATKMDSRPLPPDDGAQ